MSDIDKIQIIHDVKEAFNVDETHLSRLVDQIEKNEFKENLERFFRGYKIEDQYSYIFGALPWIKLVHGLEQNQFPPISKEDYQVPDYLCVFEDSKKHAKPLLIEVKSVKSDKKSLELMKNQVSGLQTYAHILSLPLLIAIYWEKYGLWTHVPIDAFEEETKKYKITLERAFTSDISTILGDVSFIVNSSIYRKSVFGKSSEEVPVHEKYGSVINDYISSDGQQYFEITPLESAIIDAFINMEVESENKIDDQLVVIEKSKGNYIIKLSHWMLRHIGVFNLEPNFEYSDISRRFIIELMKKLKITISYSIPTISSATSENLYAQAFTDTFVLEHYKSFHGGNDA